MKAQVQKQLLGFVHHTRSSSIKSIVPMPCRRIPPHRRYRTPPHGMSQDAPLLHFPRVVRFVKTDSAFFLPSVLQVYRSQCLIHVTDNIIRELIAVCHVERTPDSACFRIIVSAGVNRLGCDVIRLKPVFFFSMSVTSCTLGGLWDFACFHLDVFVSMVLPGESKFSIPECQQGVQRRRFPVSLRQGL